MNAPTFCLLAMAAAAMLDPQNRNRDSRPVDRPSIPTPSPLSDATKSPPEPLFGYQVVPLPFAFFGGSVELLHTPGPLDHYGVVSTYFNWMSRDVYDPRQTQKVPVASYTAPTLGGFPLPGFEGRAGYGLNLTPSIRLYVLGIYQLPNLEASSRSWILKEPQFAAAVGGTLNSTGGLDNHYDPDALVANGPILTVGPRLEADFTDDRAFPRHGIKARVGVDFGPSWLGNRAQSGLPNDFVFGRGQIANFVPFGENQTLVVNLTGGQGIGLTPVNMRFSAGGIQYLRGYSTDRFAGNQLLVGTAEWRQIFWPALPVFGNLGLSYHAFVDVGRVWETSCARCPNEAPTVAFPRDLRGGLGVGLGLLVDRKTALRLEMAVGTEGVAGIPVVPGVFTLPLMIAFGTSLAEDW